MNPTTSRENRSWPGYIFGGRLRTSTAALLVAFFAIWWTYETFEPAPTPQQVPASEVVPPGFIPDPNYTWAPRTDVKRQTPTTSTSPTTTSTSPTTTTTSTSATPDEPSTTSPQPGQGTATASAEPSRATDSPGPSTPERSQPPTQTPAAAAVGPSTPEASPPQ